MALGIGMSTVTLIPSPPAEASRACLAALVAEAEAVDALATSKGPTSSYRADASTTESVAASKAPPAAAQSTPAIRK